MGIVSLPPEMDSGKPTDCAICSVRIALTGATAGQHSGRGCQMFACVSHFMEVELLILGWADFVIQERERELEAGREPRYLGYKGDGPDVWLDS
jgi:hypothetical protein